MRICPACSTKYPDDANFCPMDASRLTDAPVAPPEPAVPAPATPDRTLRDMESPIAGRFAPAQSRESNPLGEVVRATDLEAGGAVVVQIVETRALPTPALGDRVLRELKQLGKAKSERILRVVDQGRLADGRLYVATEAVDGPTLEAVMAAEGPLPLQRAREIVHAVGEALVEAQKLGVIHRDLSPRHVYVGGTVKLSGFGLAEPATDKVFGAPGFLSPEQAEGKPVDQRSNIYSLGALLYYALVGEPPFAGDAEAMVQQHLHAEPQPPSVRRPGLPPELDRLVLKAMEKSGGRRHLTLRQLLNEIDALPPESRAAAAPVHRAEERVLDNESSVALAAAAAGPVALSVTAMPPEPAPSAEPAAASPGDEAGELPASDRPTVVNMMAVTPDAVDEPADAVAVPEAAPAPAADDVGRGADGRLPDLESGRTVIGMAPVLLNAPSQARAPEPVGPLVSVIAQPVQPDRPPVREEPAAPPIVTPAPRSEPAVVVAAPAPAPAGPRASSSQTAKTVMTMRPPALGKPGPQEKKGGFRETAWFKKGEIEEEMAKRAAEMAAVDPLSGPAATEAVVDDSSLTAEDRERLSLKTGRTEMMPAVRPKAVPGEQMTDAQMIAEMDSSRKWLFAGGAFIALLAVVAAVYFLFLRS